MGQSRGAVPGPSWGLDSEIFTPRARVWSILVADCAFGVVSKAEAVDAVGGLELPGGHHRGFVVARDDGSVDRALDAVAFYRKSDLLRYGLSRASGFVHRGVDFPAAIHLKWIGAETTHDEFAISIGRAVEIALLRVPKSSPAIMMP